MHRALEIAEELLSLPTAPLVEELPAASVAAFGRERGLDGARDAAGNVVLRHNGTVRDTSTPLVLVAHLDHPGFTVDTVAGDEVGLTFRGGLAGAAAAPGSSIAYFRPGRAEPVGKGEIRTAAESDGRLRSALASVTDGTADVGGFAMWGFPGFEVVDDRIRSRACDDLLGAAAALATLETAARNDADAAVWGLFTRAEEIGLLGAFEAIRLGTVPPDAVVLSLETSKALPGAPQGNGVIVRVGDRRSIFDPVTTAALQQAAERAGRSAGVRSQRRLMDGGVCEASAFCAAGYRSSGLAVPLGNYHNASDDGGGVAAEHVLVEDYLAEVTLLEALIEVPLALGADDDGWLAERSAEAQRMLSGAA